MANQTANEQIAGTAMAAYALSQLAFAALVQNGILLQAEAVERLQMAIDANKEGGPENQIAAALLELILNDVKTYEKPRAQ
jgi:hypothetical protein